ncbi:MAG: hypothetical protein ACI96M_004735, partial [Candidatus Azotimanducaceae bacterium]
MTRGEIAELNAVNMLEYIAIFVSGIRRRDALALALKFQTRANALWMSPSPIPDHL